MQPVIPLTALEASAQTLGDLAGALRGQLADLRALVALLERANRELQDERDSASRQVGRLRDACRKVREEYRAERMLSDFTLSYLKTVLE